jgi:small subunit ribosomal protein S17
MENKSTNKKRQLTGIVVSDKMQKTRVIEITRLKKHARYEKFFKVTTRFKAHDETNQYKTGDTVIIEESRPMSRDKRWTIVRLVKPALVKEKLVEKVSESEVSEVEGKSN